MARTREQRAARKAAYRARCSTSAPSTQPKSTRCLLLEIPPEIRDMIYGYVLDTIPGWSRFTPIDAEETQERLSLINKLERLKAGNQRRRTRSSPLGCESDIRSLEGRLKRFQQPLRLGLPSVNKQLFEEVHDPMYRHVTIDVKLRTGCCFSAREMGILRSAGRIRIECKYVTNEQWSQTVVVGPCSWSSQLHHALADRSNIQSFELKAWDERFYMCVQMYCADWLQDLNRERIVAHLEAAEAFWKRVPSVRASSSLRFEWPDETLVGRVLKKCPEAEEIQQQLARLHNHGT